MVRGKPRDRRELWNWLFGEDSKSVMNSYFSLELILITRKRKCERTRRREETGSCFVAKVRVEVFAHFHAIALKRHSSIRNWLCGLPERILSEQSPWCQRKLWACSWLCSSPVSPFLVTVSLDFPCTAHAFFPERLSNHCQGIRRNFSEISTKCDAHSLSGPFSRSD
jgi:hypothetical protein